jgi:hypothetical protein
MTPQVLAALIQPFLCLAATGCITQTSVRLPGRLPAEPQLLGVGVGREPWGELALNSLGTLTINGQALAVPFAQERRNFGVGFADASALPPAWRPAHAPDGGILVAYVERASPLALAGLRPFDAVRRLGGEPVAGADALAASLAALEPGAAAVLDVETPRGSARIEAAASPGYKDETGVEVECVFAYGSSRTAWSFSLGEPFVPLIKLWSGVTNEEPGARNRGGPPGSEYRRHFAWGILWDLVRRHARRDLVTGEKKVYWTLFWAWKIGDDIAGDPVEASA